MDQQKQQAAAQQEKKPYTAPEVAELGSVEELTQQTAPGGSNLPIIKQFT